MSPAASACPDRTDSRRHSIHVRGESLPLGARLLRVLSDLADLEVGGLRKFDALAVMQGRLERYDPRVLAAATTFAPREVSDALRVRKPAVVVTVGDLLVGQGHCLTEPLLERLRNFVDLGKVQGDLWIECDGA